MPKPARFERARKVLVTPVYANSRDPYMPEGRGCLFVGGVPPETIAAQQIRKMYTFIAARTIMAEIKIEDYGNESRIRGLSHPVLEGLEEALTNGSGANSDDFVSDMLQHPSIDMRLAAVRIIEQRALYANEGFDWDRLRATVDLEVQLDTEKAKRAFGSTILVKDFFA
eukprot:CAMPEP_0198198066 /NCGR_PEP_ID=MMETSP1445-20131203/1576_1 /TAXON_ID=36898 /ORGANISM="Pyramimonas sp., Strain CCMP2087" /LENGTH=168 /DNA_ID=CAMNT_0043867513 /DNA_START=168 /DNA_END=674 /DNA_ORIENTATION=-